jgi:internalin A
MHGLLRHPDGMSWKNLLGGLGACLFWVSCGESEAPAPVTPPLVATAPETPSTPPITDLRRVALTDDLLHAEIKRFNPAYEGGGQFSIENGKPVAVVLAGQKVDNLRCLERLPIQALDLSDTGVGDLTPIQGLPLRQLMIERTKVSDLKPLAGMKLELFYASGAPVADLTPLRGMPLGEVNIVGSKVTSLAGLEQSPVAMLWLTDCPVEDISALKGVPLVSLTLHKTKVKDLSPLSGSSLRRLHIAETPVTDLSPLKGLALTRLVFTPNNIKIGMEIAKELPLQEIGTRFDDAGNDLQPPAAYWANQPTK